MMNRDEIIKIVSANDTTVLSLPNRGPWGSLHYRGNCSGYIPAFFIWKYDAASAAEIFAGSGTTSDLCKDMGIPYKGIFRILRCAESFYRHYFGNCREIFDGDKGVTRRGGGKCSMKYNAKIYT